MKKSVWQGQYQILSAELRKMREEVGFTQNQLADKLNKPQSYVSKYESGDRNLDFIEVLNVCSACSANPNQLFDRLGFKFNQ